MSQQLVIDGFAFAKNGSVQEGNLSVSRLVRLHDLLAEVSGEVSYQLSGYLAERGQMRLRLIVTGRLSLICQRCLKAVAYDLDVDSVLEVVPESAELSDDELEDDSRDFLPLPKAGDLDVAALVEDEIILNLPPVPRHENCAFPGDAESGDRLNPFAAMGGLKGKLN